MSEPTESNLARRIWRSVFPAPLIPVNDRERRRAVVETLLLHIHPPTVPVRALRFTHTWGLGGRGWRLARITSATSDTSTATRIPFRVPSRSTPACPLYRLFVPLVALLILLSARARPYSSGLTIVLTSETVMLWSGGSRYPRGRPPANRPSTAGPPAD
jgi:hypothetical protein